MINNFFYRSFAGSFSPENSSESDSVGDNVIQGNDYQPNNQNAITELSQAYHPASASQIQFQPLSNESQNQVDSEALEKEIESLNLTEDCLLYGGIFFSLVLTIAVIILGLSASTQNPVINFSTVYATLGGGLTFILGLGIAYKYYDNKLKEKTSALLSLNSPSIFDNGQSIFNSEEISLSREGIYLEQEINSENSEDIVDHGICQEINLNTEQSADSESNFHDTQVTENNPESAPQIIENNPISSPSLPQNIRVQELKFRNRVMEIESSTRNTSR